MEMIAFFLLCLGGFCPLASNCRIRLLWPAFCFDTRRWHFPLRFAPVLPNNIPPWCLLISLTFPPRAVLRAMQHHKHYSVKAAPQTPWRSSALITCLQNWMRLRGGESFCAWTLAGGVTVNSPNVRLEMKTGLKKNCIVWQSRTGWFQCRWWHNYTLAIRIICIGVQLVRITT